MPRERRSFRATDQQAVTATPGYSQAQVGKRLDLWASTRGGGKRFEGLESGSTQEGVNKGENGRIILPAYRHNLALQLVSKLPLPSVPGETGLERLEQTHWTVGQSTEFWYLMVTAGLSGELCESRIEIIIVLFVKTTETMLEFAIQRIMQSIIMFIKQTDRPKLHLRYPH